MGYYYSVCFCRSRIQLCGRDGEINLEPWITHKAFCRDSQYVDMFVRQPEYDFLDDRTNLQLEYYNLMSTPRNRQIVPL